jgi:hypothetical protein
MVKISLRNGFFDTESQDKPPPRKSSQKGQKVVGWWLITFIASVRLVTELILKKIL